MHSSTALYSEDDKRREMGKEGEAYEKKKEGSELSSPPRLFFETAGARGREGKVKQQKK